MYSFGPCSISSLVPRLFPSTSGEEPGKVASWSNILVYQQWVMGIIILLFKTSIHVYVKAHIQWFYKAYLPHLASPPETIWCLPLSCCTASLAWMAFSIAGTYVPAHPKIDQDTQYSSGREQSSSNAERVESLPIWIKESCQVSPQVRYIVALWASVKMHVHWLQ